MRNLIVKFGTLIRSLVLEDHLQPVVVRLQQERAVLLLREACNRAVAIMVDEAISHGARSIEINFDKSLSVYQFDSEEGSFRGSIDSRITRQLHQLFLENKLNPPLKVTATAAERKFMVTWQMATPSLARSKIEKVVELFEPSYSVIARNESVVIVEDDQCFASVLEKVLKQHRINGIHFNGAESGLEWLKTAPTLPAAIVLDMHMPKMNGQECLRAIKSDPRLGDIPIIMLTSDEDVELELVALAKGVDIFVSKNEDPRILVAHIKKYISRQNMRKAA